MRTILTIAAALILSGMSYSAGYNSAYQDYGTQGVIEAVVEEPVQPGRFTSQDVWREVNDYRTSKGIAPMQVHAPLCDNLVARYHAIAKHHDHSGFQEFVDEQVERGVIPAYTMVYEVFASGDTAKDTVGAWVGSMGHEIAITTHSKGCAYAHNGLAIILMID